MRRGAKPVNAAENRGRASKANLTGVDQLIIEATERTCRRSQDDATQREDYSGKKKTIR